MGQNAPQQSKSIRALFGENEFWSKKMTKSGSREGYCSGPKIFDKKREPQKGPEAPLGAIVSAQWGEELDRSAFKKALILGPFN